MDFGSGSKSEREKGLAFTLHHYTKTIYSKAETFNKIFPLDKYFIPLIGDKKDVKIADIGSGMFSTTGSFLEGGAVTIYPSDCLAKEYAEAQKRFNIDPIFPIEYQDMENLSYSDNSFDIVHCVNALDHCEDPKKAIQEMYRICKPGGYIYLRHFFNTARTQKNRGMHKWNLIMTINKDCVFWGNLGAFLLSDLYPEFVNESKKEVGYDKYNMLVSILRKT